MAEFILDVNVDLKPQNPGYPGYLFSDLSSHKKIGLVVGGRKYNEEVRRKNQLRLLLIELQKAGKVRRIANEAVDQAETEVADRVAKKCGDCPPECDDLHIFALASVSGCTNVVSMDTRMAICRDKIRGKVGHHFCPAIKLIQTQATYNAAS